MNVHPGFSALFMVQNVRKKTKRKELLSRISRKKPFYDGLENFNYTFYKRGFQYKFKDACIEIMNM